MHIQLKPGLQLISRGPATMQIGLDSRHGTVLDGLAEADLEVLRSLADGIDENLVLGPPPTDPDRADLALRVRRVVATLIGSGTLLRARSGRAALARLGELRARLAPDAAAWSLTHPDAGDGWELLAARRRRLVRIEGSGRTGAVLASALASTGIGQVQVTDDALTTPADLVPGGAVPADLGVSRAHTARRAVDRALGRQPGVGDDIPDGQVPQPSGTGSADLVVLLDRAAADAARADRLVTTDVPHLSVVVRETSIIVGPLVLPGRSPCLRCLDLHRSEHDRQWPMVLAQLLSGQHRCAAPREETAIAQLAAALAALQVLGHLDGFGVPAAVGATLEVELPDGLTARRPWPVHPACGCHWPPTRPATGSTGHLAHDGPQQPGQGW
jgi:hypothetical protein